MKGKTIALLEGRRGAQVAELVARRGGVPVSAPAMSELPDLDTAAIARLIEDWSARPAKLAIFQTGVGTRALFGATDALGLTARFLALLAATTVAVRGPKPAGALRERGVRIDRSATEPYTTAEVLQSIADIGLQGELVVVQRRGAANVALDEALAARDATVIEVPTCRWALPADTAPLVRLMDLLARSRVHAVVFTSASQVGNLFAIAKRDGRAATLRRDLNATLVASIGPVCSAALREREVAVRLEAHPPKLGPLLSALEAALSGAT